MNKLWKASEKGFVFIELVVVLGIVSVLLALIIVSVGNFRTNTSINTTLATFVTDFKNQQIKAMVGDSEGRGSPDTYGVAIQSSNYVMFHGVSFNASDTTNFSIPVDETLQLTTTFADNKIVFASNSGEITNFIQGQNTITVRNSITSEQKTIQINKYGVITSIN